MVNFKVGKSLCSNGSKVLPVELNICLAGRGGGKSLLLNDTLVELFDQICIKYDMKAQIDRVHDRQNNDQGYELHIIEGSLDIYGNYGSFSEKRVELNEKWLDPNFDGEVLDFMQELVTQVVNPIRHCRTPPIPIKIYIGSYDEGYQYRGSNG